MPRLVKKYLCDFKCGTHAMRSLKIAMEHEENCRKNPETRSCDTCKFYRLVEDYDEIDDPYHMTFNHHCYHECRCPGFDGFAHLPEGVSKTRSELPTKARMCHRWNGGEYPIELEVKPAERYSEPEHDEPTPMSPISDDPSDLPF